ncbi:hypothetical protein [Candidatus Nitrosocosmicus hydrocola]|uniref:hypothetical protein n=1 Tax=Candidatus Nitrosocosmicus hydrocola TaxID=1826872 RepID=UPI0011E5B658|nr:hypothetical protein [Candidatus Nitrosocosmicus hydrocola]
MTSYVLDNRKIYLCVLLILLAVVIDTSLVKVYNIVDKNILSISEKKILYAVNSLFLFGVEFYFLYLTKKLLDFHSNTNFPILMFWLTLILFAIQVAVFLLLLFEIFYYNYYEKILTITISIFTYGTASFLLFSLALKFFFWFKTKKNLRIFLYFLSMSVIASNLIFAALYTSLIVNDQASKMREFVGGSIFVKNEKFDIYKNLYLLSSILSFTFIWVTTALLMKNYKEKIWHTVRYWSLLSLPLLYFLFNYFYDIIIEGFLKSLSINNAISIAIFLTIFLSLSKPIGGLTFGFLFWKLSTYLRYEKNLQTYMIISGIGIMLLFTTNQITLQTLSPFPPFGLTTVSVLVIAGFLLVIGIYNSATLVSLNANLRKIIYDHAMDSKLIGLISSAEYEGELEKTVQDIFDDQRITQLEQDYPIDLDETQIKDQLDFIVNELNKNDKSIT